MELINWQDFTKIELRVGEIIDVQEFPEARNPAYKLVVNFGEQLGTRKSSAQITSLYSKQDLLNKRVVAVINFPKKQIGPFMSECLVTGFHNTDNHVALCIPDNDVPLGSKLL